jgi:tRNA 2-selenouridine synthase
LRIITAEEFLNNGLPVIDVRTPSEYDEGHIPGAINLPIFDDEERSRVGIRYKHSGRESAVLHGLEIVGPKMAQFVKNLRKLIKGKKVNIHCWRGGMRSNSMGWLFETAGYEVNILEGGYKAYRKFIREEFNRPSNLVILGGMTGSGKTDVLHCLIEMGEQVLDLEGLAHHKGSAFGAFGQLEQPSNEQFENDLALEWSKFDFEKAVWLEDESRAIGANSIPEPLWNRMRKTLVLKMEMSPETRLPRLVREYAGFEKDRIERALDRIKNRLGGQHHKTAVDALREDDFYKVAAITLNYYDKAYQNGLSKREQNRIVEIPIDSDEPNDNARILKDFYYKMI